MNATLEAAFNAANAQAEQDRLKAVFNLVADKENWKRPIFAAVYVGEASAEEIRRAVIHFTGSVPKITTTTMLTRLHPDALVLAEVTAWLVEADGYYRTIGA